MEKRTTICDIAQKAGVSTTTVFRALNGKPRINEETKRLVLDTASQMDFRANKAAKSLARKQIKIGVLVGGTFPHFYNEVLRGARDACAELADFNVKGEYFVCSDADYRTEMVQALEKMSTGGFNGVVFMPGEESSRMNAALDRLTESGIPTAAVISETVGHKEVFSVRSNSVVSGKLAAELLRWMTGSGSVAVFTGGRTLNVHKGTVDGFMDEAGRSGLKIVGVYENYDSPEVAYRSTAKLLARYPDLGGIYIGTSNSSAVCRRVTEMGMQGRVKIVASDLFDELRVNIQNGVAQATIFQDPYAQGRQAFKRLYEYISEAKESGESVLIKPQAVFKSNLDLF